MINQVVVVFFVWLNICFSLDATLLNEIHSDDVVVKIKFDSLDENKIIGEAKMATGNDIIASAGLSLLGNVTGWNYLDTYTNPNYPDVLTAYWVGYLEGMISKSLIPQYWYNTVSTYCNGQEKICERIRHFVIENEQWLYNMIEKYQHKSSYWWQVNLIYKQLVGVIAGYNKSKSQNDPELTAFDFLFMNMRGDIYDLIDKFQPQGSPPRKLFDEGHCTAIVKLLPNNEDLYVSHTTWTRYATMIRVAKRYVLNHHQRSSSKHLIPGREVTLSGYPGVTLSIDDFYTTSSKLAVQETTTGNFNNKLWKYVRPEGVVFNFVRVQVANRLATDGKSWSKIYSKYNSGTYNNQWMVVDYKKFTPGKPPKKDLLWVLEQIPGYVEAKDQTAVLLKRSYWPSYNIPFYKDIFKRSGFAKLVEKHGKWFSYDDEPRAKIMERDHSKIKCPNSLMSFMRYNDYKNDPQSKCDCNPPYSAALAIASRKDLNPANGTFPFPFLGHGPQGATDAKYVNSTLIGSQSFVGIVGPTTGYNLSPFKWSSSDFYYSVQHVGQPDEFNFKPTLISFSQTDPN